jgi:hypothetical protein
MYAVAKAPEYKNPNDPAAGSTGQTLYSLTQTYRGIAGCEASQATGQLLSAFRDVIGKYAVFQSTMEDGVHRRTIGEVVHTMSDPLLSALDNVRPGCRAFNLGFAVPQSDVAAVDKFFADYTAFMDRTHRTSGDAEPMILFYTVTKAPGPNDRTTLYALTEIYRSMAGCCAHVAAAEATGALFSTFRDVVAKYAVHQSMTAEVVHTLGDYDDYD